MPAGEVVLVDASLEHVVDIADRMRQADRDEVLASGGYSPMEAVLSSLKESLFARTAFIDGEAAAMFGVFVGDGVDHPWLLTTDTVERHPLAFWRAAKEVTRQLGERFPLLMQMVDARYTGALSFTRRLGFKVHEPRLFGAARLPFCPITLGVP